MPWPILTLLVVAVATEDPCPDEGELVVPDPFHGMLPRVGWTPAEASFLVVGQGEQPELLDAATRDLIPSDVEPLLDVTETIGWILVPHADLTTDAVVLVKGEWETVLPVDAAARPLVPAAPGLAGSRVPCFRALDLLVDGLPTGEAVLEIEHGLTDDVAPARTLLEAPRRTTWELTVRGPDHWVRARVWSGAGHPGPWSDTVRLVEDENACTGCASTREGSIAHLIVVVATWLVSTRRDRRSTPVRRAAVAFQNVA